MGFAPLFVFAIEFPNLMRQNESTQLLATYFVGLYIWTPILSFLGDYWFTKSRLRQTKTSKLLRCLCCCCLKAKKRLSVIVTGTPVIDDMETWQRELIFSTLDQVNAWTHFVAMVCLGFWQLLHGAPLITALVMLIIAVISFFLSRSMWKCSKGRTDQPKTVWWFNFFHFNWHLWVNVALVLFYKDFCRNGLRGTSW